MENTFSENLNDLFDVAHADTMKMIHEPEGRKILEMQREKGRPGSMAGVDSKTKNLMKRERKTGRLEKENDNKYQLVSLGNVSVFRKGSDSCNYKLSM